MGKEVKPGVYRIKSENLPSAEAYLHLLKALGMGWDVTHATVELIPNPFREAIVKHCQYFTKEEYQQMMEDEANQKVQIDD